MAVVALLWLGSLGVVVCLLAGITGGVAASAVLGIAMPNLLRFLRLSPRVAAGPVALAASDMVTLVVYFNLARWLLN